jgi:hypothetical protein
MTSQRSKQASRVRVKVKKKVAGVPPRKDRVPEALPPGGAHDPASIRQRLARTVQRWVDIPQVMNVRQARADFSRILREVELGEMFLVKGPRGRDALIISVDTYRALRDAYLELHGKLEARSILEDDEARERLQAASESEDYRTLDEIEERYSGEMQEDSSE